MRKLFVLLMIATLSLCGCSSSRNVTDQGAETIKTETSVPESPAAEATQSEEPTQDTEDDMLGGKYKVEFGSAEKVKGTFEDVDLLLVTYNFTNNSEDTISADCALMLKGFQDGIEVEKYFDIELTGENESKSIRPGASLECKALFKLSSTSDLEVEATELFGLDNSKVLKTYTIQ